MSDNEVAEMIYSVWEKDGTEFIYRVSLCNPPYAPSKSMSAETEKEKLLVHLIDCWLAESGSFDGLLNTGEDERHGLIIKYINIGAISVECSAVH